MEYEKAKDITRKRLYLETMEQIMPGIRKFVIDPEAGKGILIVFEKTRAIKKGPAGPTKESGWIEGRVEEISADLSHFTVRKIGEDERTPKIGDPVTVLFQWPVETDIALEGALREQPLAVGQIETVRGDEYVVRVDHGHSGAKIIKGSKAIIRWY